MTSSAFVLLPVGFGIGIPSTHLEKADDEAAGLLEDDAGGRCYAPRDAGGDTEGSLCKTIAAGTAHQNVSNNYSGKMETKAHTLTN